MKIFGITIFFFGLLAVIATYNDIVPFWLHDNTKEMRALWIQDIQLLAQNEKLPKQWEEVKDVKYFPMTASTAKFLKDIEPPLMSQKTGKYRLEISLDDWKDKGEDGMMIQYQLFDIATQNLFWELDRTLILKDAQKLSSDARPVLQSKTK